MMCVKWTHTPDADFSGTYVHDKTTYPACVNSCAGFIITFTDCPFLRVSKLQTDNNLLTMEAKK